MSGVRRRRDEVSSDGRRDAIEDYRTDQAIVATVGVVRMWPNGDIVSTEFSASNGPRTAGGAFPPVDDPGDGTANNPNHRWTSIIDADTLASRYGLGALTSAAMVEAASSVNRQFDGIWFNDILITAARTHRSPGLPQHFGLPITGIHRAHHHPRQCHARRSP